NSYSLAWGDVDGDGDLDLAVGNNGEPNRLYRNDGGTLTAPAVWSSEDADDTNSIAWGDVDTDGDLDLAVGNDNQPNRLYRNNGGTLSAAADWSTDEVEQTTDLGWGDVDGDGDLDLGVVNRYQANRLYINNLGVLEPSSAWVPSHTSYTRDLAWGDADGDGDFDLAVATDDFERSRVYRNDNGSLANFAAWVSPYNWIASSVAWGDVDSDGDLDLAHAHVDAWIHLYQNVTRGSSAILLDAPPTVTVSRPGITADAGFFSTPEIIKAPHVPINYVLYDPEGDLVPKIFPEYSPNGGGQWFAASAGPGGDGLIDLLATPEGTAHTFVWNANADLIKSDNVVFRISAQPNHRYSPILWPAQGSQSYSFRVAAAPWFAKVVDEDGQAVAGAIVYYNGELVATNDGVPALSDPGRVAEIGQSCDWPTDCGFAPGR
ncbi:MAG: VCBS repeat-containing protein, partial [Anaerolineaceae bacterium]